MLPLSLLQLFYSRRAIVLQTAISGMLVIGKNLKAKGVMGLCVRVCDFPRESKHFASQRKNQCLYSHYCLTCGNETN